MSPPATGSYAYCRSLRSHLRGELSVPAHGPNRDSDAFLNVIVVVL